MVVDATFPSQKNKLPLIKKVKIFFQNDQIHFQKWNITLSQLSGEGKINDDQFSENSPIHLTLNHFRLWNRWWRSWHVVLSQRAQVWHVALHANQIEGGITIPSQHSAQSIRVNLTRLLIASNHSQQNNSVEKINPNTIPAMDITIQDLRVNDRLDGKIHFVTEPAQNGLFIREFTVQSPLVHFTARGDWLQLGLKQQTRLRGQLMSTNLGAVLSQRHLSSRLQGGDFSSDFALQWFGTPKQFSLSQATGKVQFDLQKGTILQLDSNTENNLILARLFNLFSLESISRFLTFDFSALTKKGFRFDEMQGKFDLQNGALLTRGIDVDSSVANINLSGKISLEDQSNDLKMRVLPHVSSSFPTLIGLTSGPVAGAAAWVANQLVASKMSELMEINYHITGTWDKPIVNKV